MGILGEGNRNMTLVFMLNNVCLSLHPPTFEQRTHSTVTGVAVSFDETVRVSLFHLQL